MTTLIEVDVEQITLDWLCGEVEVGIAPAFQSDAV